MIFMLVVSILFGAVGWRLQRARRQERAVATLRRIGAEVIYDYDINNFAELTQGYSWPRSESPVTPWLLDRFGHDFFHNVVAVRNYNRNARAKQDVVDFWQAVADLKGLKGLFAAQDWVTGRWPIAAIHDHNCLRDLTLCEGRLAPGDLSGIGELKSIERLSLARSTIYDSTIQELSALPHLRELNLNATAFDNEKAERVAQYAKLDTLWVDWTQLSDRGLMGLAACKSLRILHAPKFNFSKACLAEFTRARPDVKGIGELHIAEETNE